MFCIKIFIVIVLNLEMKTKKCCCVTKIAVVLAIMP